MGVPGYRVRPHLGSRISPAYYIQRTGFDQISSQRWPGSAEFSTGVLTGGGAPVVEAAVKFGVGCVGLSELIFKDDDAARRI
jgi:hypothetical protein